MLHRSPSTRRRARIVRAALFLSLAGCLSFPLEAASLRLLLPEKAKFLERQRVDLVVEIRGTSHPTGFAVKLDGRDITARFRGPVAADLDCDGTEDAVYSADLFEFERPGRERLEIQANAGGQELSDSRFVDIHAFELGSKPRNVILFIGDAMGNAYRDAGRIVSRSVPSADGRPGLREGQYDRWMDMDNMPVSGMVLTHSFNTLVTDSAASASGWSTGNKTNNGMLSALPDGTDCHLRGATLADLGYITDNPRVESILEYLKRRFGYRTGDVSTAFITDATPAAEGAHVASRGATFEVARQYFENPMLDGKPAFDVLLGGGKEDFDPDIRSDKRNLVAEFEKAGYRFVSTASELKAVDASTPKLLGLFRRPNHVATAKSGLKATANGNMDVTYDKLAALGRVSPRPGSEPVADFGTWTDQPYLPEMTRKAIELLSADKSHPFALQVEGALVDKQSHEGEAAGAVWEVIDLDHAVGVAREWARKNGNNTLILVTADHDQTMTILGAANISDADLANRTPVETVDDQKVYKDVKTNLRSQIALPMLTPELRKYANDNAGFPDYQDANKDGYPDNRESNGKGRMRLAVGFRTGDHAGTAVPITAEGPGAALFTGYQDQTEIPFKIAVSLSGETDAMDKLMVEVERERRQIRNPEAATPQPAVLPSAAANGTAVHGSR